MKKKGKNWRGLSTPVSPAFHQEMAQAKRRAFIKTLSKLSPFEKMVKVMNYDFKAIADGVRRGLAFYSSRTQKQIGDGNIFAWPKPRRMSLGDYRERVFAFARQNARPPVDMTDVILACDPGPAEPVGMVVRVAKSRNLNGQMIGRLSPNGFKPLLPKPETAAGQPDTKKEDSSDDGIF